MRTLFIVCIALLVQLALITFILSALSLNHLELPDESLQSPTGTLPQSLDSRTEALGSEQANNHGSRSGCNTYFKQWFHDVYKNTMDVHVLDVGGGRGNLGIFVSQGLDKRNIKWDCIDVYPNGPCTKFDGKTLKYDDSSADLVVFNYVLHHAADYTLSLIQQAKRVTKRYIAVTEDLKGDDSNETYLQYLHEWHGTFRGQQEWETLFDLLGLQITYRASPGKECEKGMWLKVPRMMWVLEKKMARRKPILAQSLQWLFGVRPS